MVCKCIQIRSVSSYFSNLSLTYQANVGTLHVLTHAQVQFSLLSRYPLTSGLLDACKELGVQPIGYSPLALGLLADKYTEDKLPNGIRGILFREFLPIMRPLLGELREIAKTRRKTVSQVSCAIMYDQLDLSTA